MKGIDIIALGRDTYVTGRGVQISQGIEATKLDTFGAYDLDTFFYSKLPGILYVQGKQLFVEPDSLTRVAAGTEVKLTVAGNEKEDPIVAYRVPGAPVVLSSHEQAFLQRPYVLNRDEWNSSIIESIDGKVVQFNDNSRYLAQLVAKGKPFKSGLFTLAFKESPINISGAYWSTGVHNKEILHMHNVLEENYVTNEGKAVLQIGVDDKQFFDIPKGSLAVVSINMAHKLFEAIPSANGLYRHLCAQYPSITMDNGERVNLDDKTGLDISKL